MAQRMSMSTVVAIASLFLGGAAAAGDRPNVEYSADQSIETEAAAMKGKVFSTPTRERREMGQGGANMIMIMRHDKKVIWTLMPEEKMYMEMPMKESNEKTDMSAYKIEQTPLGEEKLHGQTMDKSKIVMTHSSGSKMGGFMWTTKEGILAKMDAIRSTRGARIVSRWSRPTSRSGDNPPTCSRSRRGSRR